MIFLAVVMVLVAGYVATAWWLDRHERRSEGWIKMDEEGWSE